LQGLYSTFNTKHSTLFLYLPLFSASMLFLGLFFI